MIDFYLSSLRKGNGIPEKSIKMATIFHLRIPSAYNMNEPVKTQIMKFVVIVGLS